MKSTIHIGIFDIDPQSGQLSLNITSKKKNNLTDKTKDNLKDKLKNGKGIITKNTDNNNC